MKGRPTAVTSSFILPPSSFSSCGSRGAGVRLRRLLESLFGGKIPPSGRVKRGVVSLVALRSILSAFGKLGLVALIAVAFAFGLLTTIYISLRSPNIQVPEVTGKTYLDGEKVLSKTGLDIRERAKRYKPEVPPGGILDQSPHAGDTVKEGQTIAVVVSRAPKEGEQPPDEAVAEERREERGTEGLDENRNTNSNRRKPANKNTNGNANSNAGARTTPPPSRPANSNRRPPTP